MFNILFLKQYTHTFAVLKTKLCYICHAVLKTK